MYKCRQCNKISERPLIKKDDFDDELYRVCPVCGGNVDMPAEVCSLCGRELFAGDRAYEAGADIYCEECVTEVSV